MLDLFKLIASWLVPLFVVTSMLNVGLTQKPSRILHHLRNYRFLVRMVATNLIIVPALMVFTLQLVPVEDAYAAGLIVFSLAAGAPFLIKLTAASEHDLALGATVLMVLMAATVALMPILLPLLIEGLAVDSLAIVRTLLLQMIAPMLVGMAIAEWLESLDAVIQPWVARISNIALYGLILSILVGYVREMADPRLWLAILVGAMVLAFGFFVGYMMGDGRDHLNDMGGLATAQRGTASAMIVAGQNFEDPRVLVVITLLNTIGVVFLIVTAKALSKDNEVRILEPVAADPPQRHRSISRADLEARRSQEDRSR